MSSWVVVEAQSLTCSTEGLPDGIQLAGTAPTLDVRSAPGATGVSRTVTSGLRSAPSRRETGEVG